MVVPWAIKTKLVTRYCSPQDLQVAQKMSAMGGLHEKIGNLWRLDIFCRHEGLQDYRQFA